MFFQKESKNKKKETECTHALNERWPSRCDDKMKTSTSANKQDIKRDGKPNIVACQNVRNIERHRIKPTHIYKNTRTQIAKEKEKGNDLKDSVKAFRIDRHMYLCPRYSVCHSFCRFRGVFLMQKQKQTRNVKRKFSQEPSSSVQYRVI